MEDVHRICAACGKNTPLDARHCPHCGHDTHAGTPMRQQRYLPATVTKAALPVLATVGTVVLRMMWRLLRDRMLTAAPPTTSVTRTTQAQPMQQPAQQPARRTGRSIRIRTAWAVGDAKGIQRQGYTDQQIDFDE